MKVIRYIFFAFVISALAWEGEALASSNSNRVPSSFLPLRFAIPADLVDEVWASILADISDWTHPSAFSILTSAEEATILYFDTPDLRLLARGYSVQSKGKSEVLMDGEYIQLIGLEARRPPYEYLVKHYKVPASKEEKHPLLGIVKRSSRSFFLDHLAKMGISDPFRLVAIAQEKNYTTFVGVGYKGVLLFKVGLRRIIATKFKLNTEYWEISFEFDATAIATLSPENISWLGDLFAKERAVFVSRYPMLHQKEASKYAAAIFELQKVVPSFLLLSKYPLLYQLCQALFFFFVGFLVLFVFFRRRIMS